MPVEKISRKNSNNPSDEEVIKLILKDGKKELLEILYERYSDKVFHKCLSITKDREVSKDLAHDILVKNIS